MLNGSGSVENESFKPGLSDFEIAAMLVDEDMSHKDTLLLFATSNMSARRHLAAKDMAKYISQFQYEDAIQIAIPIIHDLSRDRDSNVREAIVNSMPHVSEYFLKFHEDVTQLYAWEVTQFIIPVLLKAFVDNLLPIRDASMRAFLKIAQLLGPQYVEENILPSLGDLTKSGTEDAIVMSINTLSLLSELVSPEVAHKYILNPIVATMKEISFRVRKSIVESIEKLSSSVGYQISLSVLLPLYVRLTKDEIWSIRKVCAEVIVGFARNLPVSKAGTELVPILQVLLADSSKWVRFSASESIGPFMQYIGPEFLHQSLLTHFISLAKPPVSYESNPDSPIYCANGFAGILSLLGPSGWVELEPSFFLLVDNMQARVRCAVASTLSSIAKTIGPEKASSILTPIYVKLLNDINEVKTKAAEQMSSFASLITPESRKHIFVILPNLIRNTNMNWRFRVLLTEQLSELCQACTVDECGQYILPLAFYFCGDRVAYVRIKACEAIWFLYDKFRQEGHNDYNTTFTDKLQQLRDSKYFPDRQSCAYICSNFLLERKEAPSPFWISYVEHLSKDPIPNVRIPSVRCLSNLYHRLSGSNDDILAILSNMHSDPIKVIRQQVQQITSSASDSNQPIEPSPQ